MTLTHSSTLSASKPQRNNSAEREQNPHYSHYNGLTRLARVPEKGLIAANAAFILDFLIGVLTITVPP